MRTGLVAEKVGMSRLLTESGEHIPVTLMKVFDCRVVEQKLQDKDGYTALKVAYGEKKSQRISKPMRGIFQKYEIESAQGLKEFRVPAEKLVDVGTVLNVSHFSLGQFIDVTGTSIGKGFAGVMKRHNFGGLRASHGVSITHRSHGSTGQRQDPGKVFKGKKMAGHMGHERVTKLNLEVVYVDEETNVIGIRGGVPGAAGGLLFLRDAVKKASK